ncbi:LysR family transcriptional regulator [Consotaella aegiceratis]|uniref:LysR family transcriptional regulator n=1 Tax=Consotaella aegiceratis TaxID=3097961 RepID=UPI002F42E9A0
MNLDWDDLRLFLSVARLGGLTAAAPTTGLSAATLGRRLASLEERLGEPLFHRAQTGYSLTAAGEQLLPRAEEVEFAMRAVLAWRDETAGQRVVRISAGTWTSHWLSRHIARIWTQADPFRIEFVTAYEKIDIGRHNADIGMRSDRPTEAALAARRMSDVAYCLYAARHASATADRSPMVAVTGDGANLRPARWLMAHFGDRVGVRGNDARAVRDLVAGGAGTGIFPCFVGDADPDLVRVGTPIPELQAEQWLVSHREGRRAPPVMLVRDRLVALLRAHRALFSGEQPQNGSG